MPDSPLSPPAAEAAPPATMPAVAGSLPARVEAMIAAETRRADILAAGVGLGMAGFLGLLYLVSPKALDGMSEFRPVPVAVMLFLAASALRLVIVRRGGLTPVRSLAFTVLDFTLLYGLIWSFHLQYHQPPAFYLKAPTFLLVFLFIAARALRLEPWSVVGAGVVAAIGWIGMAAYAVVATPGMPVTRDFVTYLTSNSILIGAEVEKVLAIALVTTVLTLAIRRARRQLVAAARGRTAQEDLSRFFPPEVAARIASGEEVLVPGRGELRRAGVLVCDLRGFTAFAARHEPDAVMRLLVDYQRRVGAILAAHGGAIDKFLGDGILATFGCARPTASPAADALAAGLAIAAEGPAVIAAAGLSDGPTGIGVAVTAGEVLFGTVGDADRLEFTVIGEAVNLAAKLEGHNKALGTVLVTDAATHRQALSEGFPADVVFSEARAASVPGCAGPIDLLYRERA